MFEISQRRPVGHILKNYWCFGIGHAHRALRRVIQWCAGRNSTHPLLRIGLFGRILRHDSGSARKQKNDEQDNSFREHKNEFD